MASQKELLRERVFAFWKMHRRKNKSFTANHFVAEGFLGYSTFQNCVPFQLLILKVNASYLIFY
jgi:hypothetical protein